jgi:hypothetical protein
MEIAKTTPPAPPAPAASTSPKTGRPERGRRRWEMTSANVRFFLLKPGSTAEKPELGREMASEGEGLVEAFRTGQIFLTVVAWKAVPEMDGDCGPKIVKEALART